MIDFTSALYLGFDHAHKDLYPWKQLSFGKPAVLKESVEIQSLQRKIAGFQGVEKSLIGVSTLHLFWDLFGMLNPRRFAVFYDKLLYPIGKWGIERARGKGVSVQSFRHLNSNYLETLLRNTPLAGKRPVIVTDGWCPRCGKPAPLRRYLKLLKPFKGLLVIDDTQALGILGNRPSRKNPYGNGGGGSLKWWQIKAPEIITISSFAKAFGVPMAAISGSESSIQYFKDKSSTRINNSPVSNAHIAAAINGLQLNRKIGDSRRKQLWNKLKYFKALIKSRGIRTKGGIFPVQTIRQGLKPEEVLRLNRELSLKGIKTVVVGPHISKSPELMLVFRVSQQPQDIKIAASTIASISSNLKNKNYANFIR